MNLELTPHLLNDGEVSLKASIEISSEGAPQNLGGVSEPTFNQRKIDHIIQLKEGEVSLLGGLIESTVTHSVSGVPFLGQVPLLRYFFSTEHTESADRSAGDVDAAGGALARPIPGGGRKRGGERRPGRGAAAVLRHGRSSRNKVVASGEWLVASRDTASG